MSYDDPNLDPNWWRAHAADPDRPPLEPHGTRRKRRKRTATANKPLTTRAARLMRALYPLDTGGAGDLQPLKVVAEIMSDPKARVRTKLNAAELAWEMTHVDPTAKATRGAVTVQTQVVAAATTEVTHAQLEPEQRRAQLAGVLKAAGVLADTGAINAGGATAEVAGEPATRGDGGTGEGPGGGGGSGT